MFTPSESLFSYIKENTVDTGETIVDAEGDKRLFCKVKAVSYAIFEAYTAQIPQAPSEVKNGALASIMLYLNDHFRDKVTRESVASAVGYSPYYVSHCIETLPNMNFRKLVNSLRIEYAKKLLVATDYSMINVALESGFSNERSFYRAFSELENVSPREYRRLSKGSV